MDASIDALKIYYLVILGSDGPQDITPFQGFSQSWTSVAWALQRIVSLPADVLERSYAWRDVIAQRMGGVRPLGWAPLSIDALEGVTSDQLGVFLVVFSGEKACAERIATWMKVQKHPLLHISTHDVE